MKLLWSGNAWEDYLYWQENDRTVLRRINALLQDIRRSPFKGVGKPEPLRGDLAGWWSPVIRRDHQPVRSPRSGSGLPTPLNGLRRISRRRALIRWGTARSFSCQYK